MSITFQITGEKLYLYMFYTAPDVDGSKSRNQVDCLRNIGIGTIFLQGFHLSRIRFSFRSLAKTTTNKQIQTTLRKTIQSEKFPKYEELSIFPDPNTPHLAELLLLSAVICVDKYI